MKERQKVPLAAGVYLLIAIALCGVRPLWLDEILQLIDTRDGSPTEIIRRLPANHPGGAPLGYLTQNAVLAVTGYSLRAARLPSAIFAAVAVLVVCLLASELGVRRSWLASILFAVFPLTLRYATEGRMYAEALLFSTVATLLYLKLARRQTWGIAAVYAVTLTAAAYTQPYSASVGAAHVLWSIGMRERRTALLGGTALAAAVGAFLPWYLWSREAWSAAAAAYEFQFSLRTPLMIFREMAGAGYCGSGLLLILCVLGVMNGSNRRREHWFLFLMFVVPIAAALIANALFGYFIATRQYLWVLPALAVLAAGAMERNGRRGTMLGVLLIGVCLVQSARYFNGPREDWEAAAHAISRHVKLYGACIAVAPPADLRLYRFFQPELGRSKCDPAEVVLAVTPYTSAEDRAREVVRWTAEGYWNVSEMQVGRSLLLRFRRRPQVREGPQLWNQCSWIRMSLK